MTEDSSDAHQAAQPCWAELVDKIRQNDNTGLEELYRVFSRGVRFYLCRQLGPQDLDDKVHDTFLTLRNGVPVKWPLADAAGSRHEYWTPSADRPRADH
jgi:DNA-directed RNA polymerase specialized sigma24 family protein